MAFAIIMNNEFLDLPTDPSVNNTWFRMWYEMIFSGGIGRIGVTAFAVYCVIKAHVQKNTNVAKISFAAIGQSIGRKEDAVIRAVKILCEHGYISVCRRRGARNAFSVIEKLTVRNNDTKEIIGELTWAYQPFKDRLVDGAIKQFCDTGIPDGKVTFARRIRMQIDLEEVVQVTHSEKHVNNL